ncbi:MAG: hypothetical protein ACYC2O_11705 [Microthrixaceae bacterium]
MSTETTVGRHLPTSRRSMVVIGLVLTVATLLLGSVRFARYDWTNLPLDRAPLTAERQVGPDCLEQIHPYTTVSGRVISPVVVDEQQYLALVEYYRGTPVEDLQVTCFYDPFTNRSGMSWIAHWIPGDEGVALGITNTLMLLAALWLVLLSLRAQGSRPRSVLAAGVLYAVAWNPFFFGTGVLVETGVVAALALGWYLLTLRKVWWVWPILLLGYPLKETIGILVPVVWVWCWREYRVGRRTLAGALAPALVATIAFVVGVVFWRQQLPQPAAAWEVTPDLGDLFTNLFDLVSLASFAIGVLPLLVPAFLQYRRGVAQQGWIVALFDPAVVGVLGALGICGWAFITVDLTPRLFWIGFPFAVSLAARWFDAGRPAEWLEERRIPERLLR